MQQRYTHFAGDSVRRLVLGGAFALGLALAMAPHMDSVRAADLATGPLAQADPAAGTPPPAAPDARAAQPSATPQASGPDKADAADAPDADDANDAADDADKGSPKGSGTGNHGIFTQKGAGRIRIEGLGGDREYDSFEQFVQQQPWIAGMFFVFVMILFLVPLLIIVLLIWYKLRKNRLANETMLKLAERGIVPPAAAMDAVASGTTASVAAAAVPPPGNPAYEQARYLHRRTVWSDLRKGVILSAAGLALSFWSMLDDGTANSVGLVLLFVGLGYCLLWFFEDRTTLPPHVSGTPPPGTPPPGRV
jgi:hypothetical protein